MSFQTVFFSKTDGSILGIFPNQYIKSRVAARRLFPDTDISGSRFFYLHIPFQLDPSQFKVRFSDHVAPRIVRLDGSDPLPAFIFSSSQQILSTYKNVVFDFEGGAGDYLDEADSLVAAALRYPDVNFYATLSDDRVPLLNLLSGFDSITCLTPRIPFPSRAGRIAFSEICRFPPPYPRGGKIGIYSSIAGLDSPADRNPFVIPGDLVSQAQSFISAAFPTKMKRLVALHLTSGNSNAKSIDTDTILRYLDPFLDTPGLYFAVLGGHGEPLIDHPKFKSFCGALSWSLVPAFLSLCSAAVCIDSAILHIAQHLKMPALGLFGPTSPESILDDPPGISVLQAPCDCCPCHNYECHLDGCMDKFDPPAIHNALSALLSLPHA